MRYPWIITKKKKKNYINKVLSRFGMKDCVLGDTPIAKGDKFSLSQCSKNELEQKEPQKFPYASVIRGLMYAQVPILRNYWNVRQVFK